jgi:hypothetical protein
MTGRGPGEGGGVATKGDTDVKVVRRSHAGNVLKLREARNAIMYFIGLEVDGRESGKSLVPYGHRSASGSPANAKPLRAERCPYSTRDLPPPDQAYGKRSTENPVSRELGGGGGRPLVRAADYAPKAQRSVYGDSGGKRKLTAGPKRSLQYLDWCWPPCWTVIFTSGWFIKLFFMFSASVRLIATKASSK